MNRFKRSKLFYSAFFALSAGVCCGAAIPVVTEPFATAGDLATKYQSWTGNGIVEAGEKTVPAAAGLPIVDENSNVLTVEGQVNCAAATTAGNMASVDMMVRIEEPDEALSATSLGSDSSTIQVALASEYSGNENNTAAIPLKLWCKGKTGADAAWFATGLTATPGSWHRVSFLFDYANGRCQVRFDGVLLDSENGYQTATDTTSTSGSWFNLAYVPASGSDKKISSFTVKGCTAIDDVLVLDSANAAEVTPGIAGDEVVDASGMKKSWFVENGLAATTSPEGKDASGMTYKDKFLSGVKVGAEKFEFTDMSMKTESGTVKVQLKFPINQAAPGYKNVIKYSKDKTLTTGVSEVDASADGTALIDVAKESSGPTVYYYKLETVAVSAN